MIYPPKPESQATGDNTSDYHGRPFKYTDEQLDAYAEEAVKLNTQPRLVVWESAMPESNGKSNFTAILNRADAEGLDKFSGFTIARSEYPDRVRYEADCVRYLIGDLAKKPFIRDYDADKHSGYVKPPHRDDADALNTILWLYRRLQRTYGSVLLVNETIRRLGHATGVDVEAFIEERKESK